MNPLELVLRFVRWVLRIPNVLLSVLGALFLVSAFVAAAVITSKEVAVAIAIAGTFVGTSLLSLFVPKVVYTWRQGELEKIVKDSATKQKLFEEHQRRLESERRLSDAEREIARLERMQINVDAFRSVMKLGLLEINMQITDVSKQRLLSEEEGWFNKEKNHVYVGAVQIPIEAQLGVDLSQATLRRDQDRLVVSNMRLSHVIDTREGAAWILDEIRVEHLKEGRVVRIEIDPDDRRVREQSRLHEAQVRGRLKEGADLWRFESATLKAAEQVIRALLAPLASQVVFEPGKSNLGEPILEFLGKHNDEVLRTIEQQRSRAVEDTDDADNK